MNYLLLSILIILASCSKEIPVNGAPKLGENQNSLTESNCRLDKDFSSNEEMFSQSNNEKFAKNWMNNCYYKKYNYSTPVLPNGCSEFQKRYFVSTLGNDTNNGSENFPFKTIQHALNHTDPNQCTLITIEKGDYYEALNLGAWADGSGTKVFNKLTLYSKDRDNTRVISKTIVDGWEKLTNEECPFYDSQNPTANSCNIYKKRYEEHISTNRFLHYKDKQIVPMHIVGQYAFRDIVTESDLNDPTQINNFQNGNLIVSEDHSELTVSGAEKYKNKLLEILETDLTDLHNYGSGVLSRNDLTWNGVGSTFFVYRNSDQNGNYSYIYFKNFDNEANPTQYISTHIMYNAYIVGQSNIVIQNLSLLNGRYGLSITRDSQNIKIIGNKVHNNYRSIYIVGSEEGGGNYLQPSNIEISGNELTNNFDLNHSPQFEGAYRNFILVKTGLNDAHGVYTYNNGNNINIHHNLIYNVGNGVQSWTDDKEKFPNSNLKVHHNFIVNTLDDALEPGGDCQNCHWYANHLRNTSQSIRIKIRNNNSTGPVYIYKNVIYNQDKYNLDDILHFSNQTTFYFHTPSEVPIYVYNNLFMGFRCFMTPTSSSWLTNQDGSVMQDEFGNSQSMNYQLFFINNILSCRFSMPNMPNGTWPLHYYTEQTREFDENGTEIPKTSQKNRQPLLSNNWIGGVTDHRTTVNSKSYYTNDFKFILARDENQNPLNFIYQVAPGNSPTHIFSNFDNDLSGFLERTDFCPPTSRYPELNNGGVNINKSTNLSWNFVHQLSTGFNSYYHLINRQITSALPGVEFDGQNHIGPFKANSEKCDNLGWLLE